MDSALPHVISLRSQPTLNPSQISQKLSSNSPLYLIRRLNQAVKISLRHEKKQQLVNAPTRNGDITGVKTDVLQDIATKTDQL